MQHLGIEVAHYISLFSSQVHLWVINLYNSEIICMSMHRLYMNDSGSVYLHFGTQCIMYKQQWGPYSSYFWILTAILGKVIRLNQHTLKKFEHFHHYVKFQHQFWCVTWQVCDGKVSTGYTGENKSHIKWWKKFETFKKHMAHEVNGILSELL